MNALLFGTFDGIHEGHKVMLTEARKYAERLVIALPPDSIVEHIKHRLPRHSWQERYDALMESGLVEHVVKGDEVLGTYSALSEESPDMILLGYDQTELQTDLERYCKEHHLTIPIVVLPSHQPEIYKSSLIHTV